MQNHFKHRFVNEYKSKVSPQICNGRTLIPNIEISNIFAIKCTRIAAMSATGAFNLVWFRTSVGGEEIKVNATEHVDTAVEVIALKT
jgi:hypothetical protein